MRCPYCDKTIPEYGITRDHVIPTSRGGPDSFANIRRVCARCNNDKANWLPSQWLDLLRHAGDPRVEHFAKIAAEFATAEAAVFEAEREEVRAKIAAKREAARIERMERNKVQRQERIAAEVAARAERKEQARRSMNIIRATHGWCPPSKHISAYLALSRDLKARQQHSSFNGEHERT